MVLFFNFTSYLSRSSKVLIEVKVPLTPATALINIANLSMYSLCLALRSPSNLVIGVDNLPMASGNDFTLHSFSNNRDLLQDIHKNTNRHADSWFFYHDLHIIAVHPAWIYEITRAFKQGTMNNKVMITKESK